MRSPRALTLPLMRQSGRGGVLARGGPSARVSPARRARRHSHGGWHWPGPEPAACAARVVFGGDVVESVAAVREGEAGAHEPRAEVFAAHRARRDGATVHVVAAHRAAQFLPGDLRVEREARGFAREVRLAAGVGARLRALGRVDGPEADPRAADVERVAVDDARDAADHAGLGGLRGRGARRARREARRDEGRHEGTDTALPRPRVTRDALRPNTPRRLHRPMVPDARRLAQRRPRSPARRAIF